MVDTLINTCRFSIKYGLLSATLIAHSGLGIAALPDYMDLSRAIIECRQGMFDARTSEEESFLACGQLFDAGHNQAWVYKRYGEQLLKRGRLEEAAAVTSKGLTEFSSDTGLKSLQLKINDSISEAEWLSKKNRAESESSDNASMSMDCDVLLGIPGMKLPEECISEFTDQSLVQEQPDPPAAEQPDTLQVPEAETQSVETEETAIIPVPTPPKAANGGDNLRGAIDVATELQSQSVRFGDYYALIIGNNSYQHFTDLKTAVNDAKVVSQMLEERYGFKVTTLVNASRSAIISALSKLRKDLRPTDNLLIYYAGHGSIDNITNRGYWLPVDAEVDNPANWIANDDITTQLKAMQAKHVLVVADSCYSATLTRNVELDLRTGGQAEWIKRMLSRRSRTVLTSGGLEPVVDSGQNNHSVFANAFIDELSKNQDIIEMDTIAKSVKRRVVLRARQTPVYSDILYTDHDDGDFVFKPKSATN